MRPAWANAAGSARIEGEVWVRMIGSGAKAPQGSSFQSKISIILLMDWPYVRGFCLHLLLGAASVVGSRALHLFPVSLAALAAGVSGLRLQGLELESRGTYSWSQHLSESQQPTKERLQPECLRLGSGC